MRRLAKTLPWLLFLVACSSLHDDIQVSTAHDPLADLAAVKTYQWAASATLLVDTTGTWSQQGFDLDAELRHVINSELRLAGLNEVNSGADVSLSMLLLGDREQVDLVRKKKEGTPWDPTIVTEGGLLVELVDNDTGRVVWRGGARSTAERVHSEAEVKARISHAVHELFEDFRG